MRTPTCGSYRTYVHKNSFASVQTVAGCLSYNGKKFFIRKEQGAKKYKGKIKREKSKAGKTERAGKRRTEGKKRKAEKKEKEKQKTTKSEMKKSRKLFAATLLTRGLI